MGHRHASAHARAQSCTGGRLSALLWNVLWPLQCSWFLATPGGGVAFVLSVQKMSRRTQCAAHELRFAAHNHHPRFDQTPATPGGHRIKLKFLLQQPFKDPPVCEPIPALFWLTPPFSLVGCRQMLPNGYRQNRNSEGIPPFLLQ